ncbi:tRNA pseudouridine(13) synthase TruD [Methylothermus subterraneus]
MTSLPVWPRVYGGPFGKGGLKQRPEDFQVEEILSFAPSGDGEHVFLLVEKQNQNTEAVAKALARLAAVPRSRVGYAGLKDRHALVRQWFSVQLPQARGAPWAAWAGDGFRVVQWTRNRRKLKRGALQGNRFRLCVRGVHGDLEQLEAVLRRIKTEGLANYFGPQRFGHAGGNVERAKAWLGKRSGASRHRRGLYLSAARSFLFNQVLAARVERGDWNRPLPGDWLMFDGSGAGFLAEIIDADLKARVAALELHPSGPLWGQGGDEATAVAAEVERQAVGAFAELAQGLEEAAVRGMRRPLRVRVRELNWRWQGADLHLCFALPAGAYATALLRELVEIEG